VIEWNILFFVPTSSVLEEIIDHEKDETAVTSSQMTPQNCHTTKGWRFLVSWKDGTVNRKRKAIISKLGKGKTKYWTRTHKYGIELPKTVQQALEIDSHMGTTF
jgi:hypothetical protein